MDIETFLREYLGVKLVLWLGRGVVEDNDTDGHVDNLLAFVRPGEVNVVSPVVSAPVLYGGIQSRVRPAATLLPALPQGDSNARRYINNMHVMPHRCHHRKDGPPSGTRCTPGVVVGWALTRHFLLPHTVWHRWRDRRARQPPQSLDSFQRQPCS